MNDFLFLAVTAAVAASAAFIVFLGCFFWFRREQRRLQGKMLRAISQAARGSDELFVSGRDAASCGELVAQFKASHGKRVISVVETDGRRYIHVDGEMSAPEREKMVRYLKSEGFMS